MKQSRKRKGKKKRKSGQVAKGKRIKVRNFIDLGAGKDAERAKEKFLKEAKEKEQ